MICLSVWKQASMTHQKSLLKVRQIKIDFTTFRVYKRYLYMMVQGVGAGCTPSHVEHEAKDLIRQFYC